MFRRWDKLPACHRCSNLPRWQVVLFQSSQAGSLAHMNPSQARSLAHMNLGQAGSLAHMLTVIDSCLDQRFAVFAAGLFEGLAYTITSLGRCFTSSNSDA